MSTEMDVQNAKNDIAIIGAMKELVQTIQRVNRVFVTMGIVIPIVMTLSMILLTVFIVHEIRISKSESDALIKQRSDELLDRVIHINQNVHIDSGKAREEVIEREMKRVREEEQKK